MSRRRRISARYAPRDRGIGGALGLIVVVFLVLTALCGVAVATGSVLMWWVFGGVGGMLFFFWAIYMVMGAAMRNRR